MFVCECLSVMWHMWRYPIPFPMRLARAVSKGKPIMVQALKASAKQTNFQKLRVKMPHKLCNIFESEATPAWGRLCLQGMWQMRKGKGNEKRRGAQRVPSTGQTASEEKNIMENGNFAIEQFYNCQGNAKTAETPSMENVVSEENSEHSAGGGWQQMEWREKKSKLRDTFAQLVNDLDSCGEHVCECWSIGVFVCVCVCTSRAQTDYRLSRRRRRCRRLAASEAACRELLTPHRKCACQPVCVCVCSAFCFIWIFVAKQSADSNREWVKETVPKLRQLLGALQPEVDFRVEFFAPFHCFHCNWSGLVYWVSSWNRAKPKPIADDHTRPLSWPDIDSLSALHPILHFSPISPSFLLL